jgi:hypothetical protein
MQELGPLIVLSLMRNIGGNASRSELDKLSEPLKKIASLHPMAQAWMRAALLHPSFPSQNISEEAKLSFSRKVIRYGYMLPGPNIYISSASKKGQPPRSPPDQPGGKRILACFEREQVYLCHLKW